MKYLCYDIRGIQNFIFRIPKLKYIVGGSALIDQFDRVTVPSLKCAGCELLFAGGGKGTFTCIDDAASDSLKKTVMEEAHKIGLDIRFGIDEDYLEASRNATAVYPFIPESLEGLPCPTSGLYPVTNGDTHWVVKKRLYKRGEKTFRWYENDLLKNMQWPANLERYKDGQFFHNVSALAENGANDEDGRKGAKALGNRNRWAVICMDGNDMGSQLRKKSESLKGESPEKMTAWLRTMSQAIDCCSREATKAGILAVINAWAGTKDDDGSLMGEDVVLPIRPIIVGGDDISVICHVSYAMLFVKTVIAKFNELSKITPEAWPATGGEITISAGVLFCPVSLPLHTAIDFAESLLASAKSRGRETAVEGKPAEPCLDWEFVTDSVIDSPAARRQRELMFLDKDLNKTIKLTQRPYTLKDYEGVVEPLVNRYAAKSDDDSAGIARSQLHKVLPAMRKGFYDRLAFVASIAKRHNLAQDLAEPGHELGKQSCWKDEATSRSTPVIDAIQLCEEDVRMKKETV